MVQPVKAPFLVQCIGTQTMGAQEPVVQALSTQLPGGVRGHLLHQNEWEFTAGFVYRGHDDTNHHIAWQSVKGIFPPYKSMHRGFKVSLRPGFTMGFLAFLQGLA